MVSNIYTQEGILRNNTIIDDKNYTIGVIYDTMLGKTTKTKRGGQMIPVKRRFL